MYVIKSWIFSTVYSPVIFIVRETSEAREFAFTHYQLSKEEVTDIPPQMFKPVRVVATIVLIASIGLVFVGAFVLRNGVRVVIHPPRVALLICAKFLRRFYASVSF